MTALDAVPEMGAAPAGHPDAAGSPTTVGAPPCDGADAAAAPTTIGAPPCDVPDPAQGIWRRGLLAGQDPGSLAQTYGTPLYVYDLDLVAARARTLRAWLPGRFDVAYAVKANPSLSVIAAAVAAGTGVDVSSPGELAAATRAGVPPGRTVLTGPGKSDALLARAVKAGVRAIVVESPHELDRLERAAAQARRHARVLIRLAAHEDQSFGMAWEDAFAAARQCVRSRWLQPLGVHAFGVSTERDAAVLAVHIRRTVEAGRRLALEAGFALRVVDAGGGLGIPYADDDIPLDTTRLGTLLARLDEALASDPLTRGVRVVLEPGRFLVGPAGAYLARVVDVKRLPGRRVAVLDGGINHLLAPALVGRRHRLRLIPAARTDGSEPAFAAPEADSIGTAGGSADPPGRSSVPPDAPAAAPAVRPRVPVDVVGPLCTWLDVLDRVDAFPEPRPGDLVVALDTGAYGYTQSMPWFLSHVAPAEVAISHGRAVLVRPRREAEAWLEGQRLPSFED